MVNNKDIIKDFVDNYRPLIGGGDFLQVEAIIRKKDGWDISSNAKKIASFEIRETNDLDNELMYAISRATGARLYIHLNRRNDESIALEMLCRLSKNIQSKNYRTTGLRDSVIGITVKETNKVWIVDAKLREKTAEITLDFKKAGVVHDDVADSFVGFSGVKGEELILLDVDHKAVLIFDLTGKYVGKSELPKNLKLRANNHYNGTGYANDMLFVFHEPEGEFGTYYGFKVIK
jgi:hypothetical protein